MNDKSENKNRLLITATCTLLLGVISLSYFNLMIRKNLSNSKWENYAHGANLGSALLFGALLEKMRLKSHENNNHSSNYIEKTKAKTSPELPSH